ncbi:MAG: hypothetical protein VYD18_07900 [Candidatus Latescibacterota bacterium]|nr:hypothetical protein [Candidatus Latescibacterota bacterium]
MASPDVIRYGGNTPCIEIETDDGTIVIDAGTGIRDLGKSLPERSVTPLRPAAQPRARDHIQGFPHFEPLYRDDIAVTVHVLRHPKHTLPSIFAGQQQKPFYPVPLQDMSARILCHRLNHPGVTGGFRIESGARTLRLHLRHRSQRRIPAGL